MPPLALVMLAVALLANPWGVDASLMGRVEDALQNMHEGDSRRALRQMNIPVPGVPITAVPATAVPVTAVLGLPVPGTGVPVAAVPVAAAGLLSTATSLDVGDAVISAVGASAIQATPQSTVGSADVPGAAAAASPGSPILEANAGLVVTTTYLPGATIPMIIPNVPQVTHWKASPDPAPTATSPPPKIQAALVAQQLPTPPPALSALPPPITISTSAPTKPQPLTATKPQALVTSPVAANMTALLVELTLTGTQLAPFDWAQQVELVKALASILSIEARDVAIVKVATQKSSSSRRSLHQAPVAALPLRHLMGTSAPGQVGSLAEALPYDLHPAAEQLRGARAGPAALFAAHRRALLAAVALDAVQVVLELNAGRASQVSVMQALLRKSITAGDLKSSLAAQGMQLSSVVLSSATAAVPSTFSTQCFQQSSGYCTAAGSTSAHSGLGAGSIAAIVLAVLAVLAASLIFGVIVLCRRRSSRVSSSVHEQDFKILPIKTPMAEKLAYKWRVGSPFKLPVGADDKPLSVGWSLEGDEAKLAGLREDLRNRLMLSTKSTEVREGAAYTAPPLQPTKDYKLDLVDSKDGENRVDLIAAAQSHTLMSPMTGPYVQYDPSYGSSPALGTPQGAARAMRWAGVTEIIVDSPYAPQHSVRSRHSTTPKLAGSKGFGEGSPTVVSLSPHQWIDTVKGAATRWFVNRDS